MKRIISILILCTILLCACGEQNVGTDTESEAGVTTIEKAPEYRLPERKNYNKTFTILAADGRSELYDAEQNGDVVNDAVWKRNTAVEDHLGLKLEFVKKDSGWQVAKEYNELITSTVLANDDSFDLMTGPITTIPKLASGGLFMNIHDMNIDVNNPWWIADMDDTAAINGKLYAIAGDFAVSLYNSINVMFVNDTLLGKFNLENPYELVRSGKWTLDKMLEMTADVTVDLDGDGKIDIGDDMIAIVSQNNPLRSLQSSFGIDIFKKNGDDIEFKGLSDQLASSTETLKRLISTSELIMTYGSYEDSAIPFMEDRNLFFTCALRITSLLREKTGDFGIIPLPKFNEDQADYRVDVPLSTVVWCVPVSASDMEMTADFMEVFSYYSRENVIPAYYETTLKDKYSRDSDTVEMLDLIRQSLEMTFDSYMGSNFKVNPFTSVETIIVNSLSPSSYIAENQTAWLTELQNLLDAYK